MKKIWDSLSQLCRSKERASSAKIFIQTFEVTLCVRSKRPRTIKTVLYNDIFIPLRRKIVQGPAKQFKVSVRGLTMFVFYFGVESLEQCVNLGRLVIFDFLGNSNYFFYTNNQKALLFTLFSLLELFFSCYVIVAVTKENLLNMPAIISLANSQRIQMSRHPRFAFDWLSVSFFD